MLLVSQILFPLNICKMSMVKPGTCCKHITEFMVHRSNKPYYVNPDIVGFHKCLVSNSFNLCLKYKNNLKPETCSSRLSIH